MTTYEMLGELKDVIHKYDELADRWMSGEDAENYTEHFNILRCLSLKIIAEFEKKLDK